MSIRALFCSSIVFLIACAASAPAPVAFERTPEPIVIESPPPLQPVAEVEQPTPAERLAETEVETMVAQTSPPRQRGIDELRDNYPPAQPAPETQPEPVRELLPVDINQMNEPAHPVEPRHTSHAAAETDWTFEVDERTLDFDKPIFAGEPGADVLVTLRQSDPNAAIHASNAPSSSGNRVQFELNVDYEWGISGGAISPAGNLNTVIWTLPETPGIHTLTVNGETEGETTTSGTQVDALVLEANDEELRVQVLTPFDRRGAGVIDGYPIGIYPDEMARDVPGPVERNVAIYAPPTHFWHVTEDTLDAHISPHFTLGDLTSVPMVAGEAYIAISPQLIDKLEALYAGCEHRGHIPADATHGITVLRSYVTPNRLTQLRQAGANISTFTRHIYGDAAIVIVDVDGDGLMDDLNRDGIVDQADAQLLADEVENLERTLGRGGIGVYGTRPAGDPELPDTPMVQFDCRGERARW